MWGIVIVLVGGVYWIYKYIDEKTNEEIVQKHQDNASKINKKITASRSEEDFIKSALKNKETRWEMLNSISYELNEIYGDNWKKHFQNDSRFESEYMMITSSWGKAYHLLLSKNGKIPNLFATSYQLGGVGNERMQYIIRTCKCIEKNIDAFTPGLKILFVPERKMIESGTDCGFYEDLYLGKLYWEHNIPPRNKKWNPQIKSLW